MKTWTRKTWIGVLAGVLLVTVVTLAILEWGIGPRWPGVVLRVTPEFSLDDALAAAEPGTTILLPPRLNVRADPIMISTPNVILASAGERSMLQGTGSRPVISVLADGVRLENLELIGESVGLSIEADDCSLIDSEVDSTPIGIRLRNARGCKFERVSVRDCQIGIEMVSCIANRLDEGTVLNAADIALRLTESRSNVVVGWTIDNATIGVALEGNSAGNLMEDCTISRSSGAGIELRRSNDNDISDCTIRESRIGILLDTVTGSEIRQCTMEDFAVAGVFIQQSLQNRIIETEISSSDTGILLSQSSESAVICNWITACRSGVQFSNSHKNLLSGNKIAACGIGLRVEHGDENRLLRNRVIRSDAAGVVLLSSNKNRIFDNEVLDGEWGIVLSGARETTTLRNRVKGQSMACILSNAGEAHRALENDLRDARYGLVSVSPVRCEVMQNQMEENGIGLLLIRSGVGVRLEGNTVAGNGIGIQAVDDRPLWLSETALSLGFDMDDLQGETVAPVIANNHFLRNETSDLHNESSIRMLAGGNWWGSELARSPGDEARVSERVDLDESAWRGAIAVGTERSLVQVLLGRILQYALNDAGFRVIDLVGIGDRDAVWEALRAKDVDAIWWGSMDSAELVFNTQDLQAEWLEIPIEQRWRLIGSAALMQRLPDPSLSTLVDLLDETGESLRFTAPNELDEDELREWFQMYGLEDGVRSFTPTTTLEEAEALLKFGAVDVAIVGNLEETLTISGFSEIIDDRGIVDSLHVHAIVQAATLEEARGVTGILDDLGAELTESVIHDLISRVRLLHLTPEDVARNYVSSLDVRTE